MQLKNEAVLSMAANLRGDCAAAVAVPADFSADEVHTWIACISADGQLVSNSEYAGTVTVI